MVDLDLAQKWSGLVCLAQEQKSSIETEKVAALIGVLFM